jgi:hypothetical protein
MSDTREPVPNPQVLFTELDDGTGVLLHLDTKFYYTLNRTAVFVWKLVCAGAPASPASLAPKLTEAFRVERDTAERDIAAVLDDMLADGILVFASPGA